MKVLMPSAAYSLTDYYSASWGLTAYNIMKHLAHYGCSFHAIACNIMIREPLPNARLYDIKLPSDNTRLRSQTLASLSGLYYAGRSYWMSRRILKKENFDLVHHMFPATAGVSFSLLPLLSDMTKHYPFIFGSISSSYSPSRGLTRKIASRLHYATVSKSQAIIVVTPSLKAEYSKIVDPGKIWVIPHGVDDLFFCSSTSDGKEGFEILVVANLVKRKGIDYLLRAMPLVLQENKDVRLRIIGDGQDKAELIQLARSLGIERSVIFQGLVANTDLPRFHQRADVFCLPSLLETFGKVVIEAMACGKPVIVTSTEGPAQIVSDMEDGIIIPPADSLALAEAILRLVKDSEMRKGMGRRAREKAIDKYSWARVAEQYYQVYKAVLRGA